MRQLVPGENATGVAVDDRCSDLASMFGVQGSMAIGLRNPAGLLLGVLGAHSRTRRPFTQAEVTVLERLAPVTAKLLAPKADRA